MIASNNAFKIELLFFFCQLDYETKMCAYTRCQNLGSNMYLVL